MTVTVTPERFTMVDFDQERLVALIEELLPVVGLGELAGPDDVVTLDVIESVPLGRAIIRSIDPVVLEIEGGALEDPLRPKQLSDVGSLDIIGRLLLRVRDRRDPDFGEPPPDAELTLAEVAAWETWCVGRLARAGYRAQRQRRLYAFRNRHGFTDEADAAFDRLWSAGALRWDDIAAASASALAARPVPASA
jgi:hypothetical protein